MCTIITATKPFLGAAGAPTAQVVPYDERRLALVVNVLAVAPSTTDISLAIDASTVVADTVVALDTTDSGAAIEGTLGSAAWAIELPDGGSTIPITGTEDPVTGDIALSAALTEAQFLNGTTLPAQDISLTEAASTGTVSGTLPGQTMPTTGTVSGTVGVPSGVVGLLRRNPLDPGIPLYAGTEVLQLSRDDYYDLLNGPFYWDDLGSGATLQGYDVTQIGPDSPRERT